MTKIEEEIRDSLNRYWSGKQRFGNTRVFRKAHDLKIVYVTIGPKESPIFAKAKGTYFWCDPCDGKSKLVNSRLAFLKSEFGGSEIKPEIMEAIVRVGRASSFWANNNVYEVSSGNNKVRYFRTRKGAEDYAQGKNAAITLF